MPVCNRLSRSVTALLLGTILLIAGGLTPPLAAQPPPPHQHFLPLTLERICPPFSDDFSTDQGWLEGGIGAVDYGYEDEAYVMQLYAPGVVAVIPAPQPCYPRNSAISVSTQWEGAAGDGIGVRVGARNSGNYYLFLVEPVTGTYQVLHRNNGILVSFIPPTPTDALTPDTPTVIRVEVVRGLATFYANDIPLEAFFTLYEEPTQFGFAIMSTPTQATLPIKGRFDDVRIYTP